MNEDQLLLACEALAKMIREEIPERYSLACAATTWYSCSEEQCNALDAYEAHERQLETARKAQLQQPAI